MDISSSELKSLIQGIDSENKYDKLDAIHQLRQVAITCNETLPLKDVKGFLLSIRRCINAKDEELSNEALGLTGDIIPLLGESMDAVLDTIVPHLFQFLSMDQNYAEQSKHAENVLWSYMQYSKDDFGITESIINIGMIHDNCDVREASIVAMISLLKAFAAEGNYTKVDYQELLVVLVSLLDDDTHSVITAAEEALGAMKNTFPDFENFARRLNKRERLMLHDHYEYISRFIVTPREPVEKEQLKAPTLKFGFIPNSMVKDLSNASPAGAIRRTKASQGLLELFLDMHETLDFDSVLDNIDEVLMFLKSLLQDTVQEVVIISLEILRIIISMTGVSIRLHIHHVTGTLMKRLGDPKTAIRNSCSTAFGTLLQYINNATLFSTLQVAFRNESWQVREEGIKLLIVGLLERPEQKVDVEAMCADFAALLSDDNEKVKYAVIEACAVAQYNWGEKYCVLTKLKESGYLQENFDARLIETRFEYNDMPIVHDDAQLEFVFDMASKCPAEPSPTAKHPIETLSDNEHQEQYDSMTEEELSPDKPTPSRIVRRTSQDPTVEALSAQLPNVKIDAEVAHTIFSPHVSSDDLPKVSPTTRQSLKIEIPNEEERVSNMASQLSSLKSRSSSRNSSRKNQRRAISAEEAVSPSHGTNDEENAFENDKATVVISKTKGKVDKKPFSASDFSETSPDKDAEETFSAFSVDRPIRPMKSNSKDPFMSDYPDDSSASADRPIRPAKSNANDQFTSEYPDEPASGMERPIRPMKSNATDQFTSEYPDDATPITPKKSARKAVMSLATRKRLETKMGASSPKSNVKTNNNSVTLPKSKPAETVTSPTSAKKDAYLTKEQLEPLSNPKQTLSKLLPAMRSKDWAANFDSLDNLRRLATFHSEIIDSKIHEIIKDLVKQIHNLRSSVSKNAMLALQSMLESFNRSMDSEIDEFLHAILKRVADTNSFISAAADETLESIVENISSGRILSSIAPHITSKSNLIRMGGTKTIYLTIKRMDARLASYREANRLFSQLGTLLMDGHADVRNMAKDCIIFILENNIVPLKTLESSMSSQAYSKAKQLAGDGYIQSSNTIRSPPQNLSKKTSNSKSHKNISARPDSGSAQDAKDMTSIQNSMQSSNWKERLDGIRMLKDYIGSGKKCKLQTMFDSLNSLLEDGNLKVNIAALEALKVIIPSISDEIEQVLPSFIPKLASNLASKNKQVSIFLERGMFFTRSIIRYCC